MKRSITAALLITALHAAPTIQAQQLSLQAPAGLTVESYSPSAVEVFWLRVDEAVGYSVTRDGERLATIDGLSFFEEGLESRTTYQYEIRSVDASGNESESNALVTVTTRGGSPEVDATRPLSLRADVYSNTALELFWRPGFPRPNTYEIKRDGIVIGTTDGASFFEDGLTPGTQYEYTVTLLNSDSPPARITSTTTGGNNIVDNNPIVDNGNNIDTDPILNNARLAVYSDTTAELLWDRPEPQANITRVEVLRDTESLGRFDATSFFDDTRLPGIDYNYTLIARDNGGNELGRVNINANDSVAPESIDFVSPILGEFNETQIVNLVFSALSGQAFGNDVLRLPYHSNPLYSNAELLGGAPADAVFADTVCDNGGTAQFEPLLILEDSIDSGWEFDFDNCLDGTAMIDGEITRTIRGTPGNSGFVITSTESSIRVDSSERNAQFSGVMLRTFQPEVTPPTMQGLILNVEYTENGETFAIMDGDFLYTSALPFSARIEGTLQVRSPVSQNRFLDVVITEPFTWSGTDTDSQGFFGDWVAFSAGSMTITAEDGTQMQVDAGIFERSLRINVIPGRAGDTFFPWTSFSESLPLFVPSF